MSKTDDTKFLTKYLCGLRTAYRMMPELSHQDLGSWSEEERAEHEATQERVARLADKCGFDGSLFRDHLLETFGEDPLGQEVRQWLGEQILTLSRIIAKIEEPADPSLIPDDAQLVTIPQLARLLGWGESLVRERDRKGLLPRPVCTGGKIQWRRDEINAWIRASMPVRETWERQRKQWMEEDNVAA